jgi:beta-N-acetylhexosaminidase
MFMTKWLTKILTSIPLLVSITGAASSAQNPHPFSASHEEADQWADQTLRKLTLEKKVSQLVFADISGGYITDDDSKLRDWIRLAHLGVGGMVIYGGTPVDNARLLNRLQREAELPILMASDFEGGPGQQVAGATEFPGDMALSAIGSEELAYQVAKTGAMEGRAMGVRLTYSPVMDISTRPGGPAESVRSFGGDVELMGRMAKAYIRGYQENGMLTTAKHFPGRGNVETWLPDPAFTTINKSAAQMEAQEFAAFKKAIDAGVTFVMTEHIIVPSMTNGSDLPASVERQLATGWLRDRLGFKGLLTTDDLWYDHVVKRFGAVQVGVKALQAGHDLLLKPKDAKAMIDGVVTAVRAGEVSQAHIDQAARKLLYWKARLNLHQSRVVDETRVNSEVGTPAHWKVAQEVADRSLTLLRNDGVLPVPTGRLNHAVNINIQKLENDPSPPALSAKLATAFPNLQNFTIRPDMNPAAYQQMLVAARGADLIVLSLFVQRNRLGDATPLRDQDLDLIDRIAAEKPGAVIAMSYGNPHLIRKLGTVPCFVVGYGERSWFGNQPIYFDSFIKLLKSDIKPQGKLPILISEKYPLGSGLSY